ncbi:MAG: acetyl-CoA carboxylase, biotin carboxyl carrier protein [Lachnospiraceae bacterium]|nr:acetyl-CoA carboxylase, biotin carboxyl carrier protein [Lachnospiraceae bacterium]
MSSLQEYAGLFEKLNLTELQVEEEGLKLTLKREGAPVPVTTVSKAENPITIEETSEPVIQGDPVKAPLLGIFYAGDGKGNKKNVGDTIAKGEVLCTIEAMKMMNEVKAPRDGVIKEVMAQEGALVECNQTLFVLE